MIQFDNRKKAIMALMILAVMYTVVVFALPLVKNSVFVISYLFALLAVVGQTAVWHFGWHGKESIQSKFYGYPVIAIGMVYMLVQLGGSLLFMLLARWVPLWIPSVLYVLLLGVMLIGCIAADIARTEIERVEKEQTRDTQCMRKLRAMCTALYQNSMGSETEGVLDGLCWALQYSDPVSTEELKPEEEEMLLLMNQMAEKQEQGQYGQVLVLADRMKKKLQYRNQMCRAGKESM